MSVTVLLVHGFHPWAEDGGLYVAGVEYLLQPSLFPKETTFVTEHLAFSAFAPLIAHAVRFTHLSLASVLLAAYLLSAGLMLFAVWYLAAACFDTARALWLAVGLLAAWWTLPVAGTSLLLMDPYVTARSFSTPLSVLAIACAMRWHPRRTGWQAAPSNAWRNAGYGPLLSSFLFLLFAAAMHPLMAGYALALIAVMLCQQTFGQQTFALLFLAAFAVAASMQASSPPDLPAVLEAVSSRYYWFLSQWHWYEWLGLVFPLGILLSIVRTEPRSLSPKAIRLCRATLLQAAGAIVISVCFARLDLRAHPVARLQPLRAFSLLYVVMTVMLGGFMVDGARHMSASLRLPIASRLAPLSPILLLLGFGSIMFSVQRTQFRLSPHVELPGLANHNPWCQAFLWARTHTAQDALFALDARYVNTDGEDAQTFRAISQRSAIPDYSKDGGEAAITPRLATDWQRSATATQHLSDLTDTVRDERLRPFHVQWVVLNTSAVSAHPCPYRNATVKLCQLP